MNGINVVGARGKEWVNEVEQLDEDEHEHILFVGMEADVQRHVGGCRCVRELAKVTHQGGDADTAEKARLLANNVMRQLDALAGFSGEPGVRESLIVIRQRLETMTAR